MTQAGIPAEGPTADVSMQTDARASTAFSDEEDAVDDGLGSVRHSTPSRSSVRDVFDEDEDAIVDANDRAAKRMRTEARSSNAPSESESQAYWRAVDGSRPPSSSLPTPPQSTQRLPGPSNANAEPDSPTPAARNTGRLVRI